MKRKPDPHTVTPYIVEWWTDEGVCLQSHEMPREDAEAMAAVLDGEAEIVPV